MPKIDIKGPIIPNNDQWIYDWLDMEATSPKMVLEKIKDANGEDLEVEINSGGGAVFEGSEIYTALKEYAGNVTVKIVGIAASAASVIAMAGKTIKMSPTSQMMIHNATTITWGDHRDMNHMAEVLKNVNQTVANAYKLKSGKTDEELLSLMDAETWFTPQQALDNGLIDEIMFESQQIVANFNSGILPPEVISRIRNKIEPEAPETDVSAQQKAKLNLLRLKGDI